MTPSFPVLAPLQVGGFIPRGTRITVFRQIFDVFLVLGTIVGVVVISYLLWNAYKYRARDGEEPAPDADVPQLGELPRGGGGGKKLLLSFSLSAVIVISLVVWTYGTLLYVEQAPQQEADALDIDVVGKQFAWEFHYPNGYVADSARGEPFRVPRDRMIRLSVTSRDVFHNLGVPGLRVKTDALPGQTTESWFEASETGTYEAQCYELCGAGHSYMTAEVVVMEPEAWNEWYANTTAS